jgi:L-aspartate oxidase
MVLRNMILTARLITAAALMRKESRGGHYRTDYPATDPAFAHRTFITIEDIGTAASKSPSLANVSTLAVAHE